MCVVKTCSAQCQARIDCHGPAHRITHLNRAHVLLTALSEKHREVSLLSPKPCDIQNQSGALFPYSQEKSTLYDPQKVFRIANDLQMEMNGDQRMTMLWKIRVTSSTREGGRYCHFAVTIAEAAASVLTALLDMPSPLQCPNTSVSSKPPSPKSPSQAHPFASGHPPLALIFKELYLLNATYDITPWWSPSTIFHYRMVLLLVALWDQPEKCNYSGRVYLAQLRAVAGFRISITGFVCAHLHCSCCFILKQHKAHFASLICDERSTISAWSTQVGSFHRLCNGSWLHGHCVKLPMCWSLTTDPPFPLLGLHAAVAAFPAQSCYYTNIFICHINVRSWGRRG